MGRCAHAGWINLQLEGHLADTCLSSCPPRSSDFGTSYTKLTLQPGVTTVIDNFYICPTNKRKVRGHRDGCPVGTAGLPATACDVTASPTAPFPAPP